MLMSSRFLFSVCLIVVLTVSTNSYSATSRETMRLLELFGDVFDKVKRDYVEEVDDKELIESAINGMLTSLDPHSSYLNEKAFDEMRIQTRGEFGGLGIEVTMENGLVKVVSPIDDTPAFKAGMKAGDYISRIDGEPVMGSTLNESVEKMRGKPGTEIDLTVLREGESEPLQITIVRDVITIKSVRARSEGNVAYLRITSFSEQTARSLRKEFKSIVKGLAEDESLAGVVLDLRNNPGGLLDQAIEVSDLFLTQGEIVSTGGRVSDSNKRFHASPGDMASGKPLVVLINGGSASASEIVAGAIQDHKRGIVMGTKSFGKGSVQTVIPLTTSSGAMRLTTSRYYTPSGRSIQAEGIDPDIIVEQSKVQSVEEGKERTSESTLRKHLKAERDAANEEKDEHRQLELYETDYQLARAIDLIHALNVIK